LNVSSSIRPSSTRPLRTSFDAIVKGRAVREVLKRPPTRSSCWGGGTRSPSSSRSSRKSPTRARSLPACRSCPQVEALEDARRGEARGFVIAQAAWPYPYSCDPAARSSNTKRLMKQYAPTSRLRFSARRLRRRKITVRGAQGRAGQRIRRAKKVLKALNKYGRARTSAAVYVNTRPRRVNGWAGSTHGYRPRTQLPRLNRVRPRRGCAKGS